VIPLAVIASHPCGPVTGPRPDRSVSRGCRPTRGAGKAMTFSPEPP